MLPALSPAQWITLAAVAAAGFVLAVLFLKLGLKLLKALLILILLAFVALTTFWKSFTRSRPVRKSAVYLMEEHPA